MDMADATLPAKQEAFCAHYAVHRNGPAAYVSAYNVGADTKPATIASEASRLLADPKISARVAELANAATMTAPVTVTLADMFVRDVMIVQADPNELMELKWGNCRYCNGEGFQHQWRDEEYARALDVASKNGTDLPAPMGGLGWRPFHPPHPDCPECGGAGIPHPIFKPTGNLSPGGRLLYRGIKQTNRGLEILVADQTKSAENVVRMLGGFKDNVNLTGALGVVAKVAQLAVDDPHAAARAYEDFLKAGQG